MTEADLLSLDFLNKVASVKCDQPETPEDQEQVMCGLIEFMKDAGYDPFFCVSLFDSFLPEGNEKLAGQSWEWFKEFANPMPGHWDGSAAERVGKGLLSGGIKYDPKTVATDFPAAFDKMQKNYGGTTSALSSVFQGDKNKVLDAGMQFARGDYSGGLKNVWDGVASHPFVKKWAPYVVPAVATFAAGKMMGMGNAGSAALGVAGGALSGGIYSGVRAHGSFPNFVNNGIQKKFFPKSNSGKPWISEPPDAKGLNTSLPDPTMQATQDHAAQIGQSATSAPKPNPTPPSSAVPDTTRHYPNGFRIGY